MQSRGAFRVPLQIILYLLIMLGSFGVAIQFHYMSAFIESHRVPGSNELLAGVAYATLIFGAFWVGAPILAILGRIWFNLHWFNIAVSAVPLMLALGIWQWPKVL
jgi:hypothetical protein